VLAPVKVIPPWTGACAPAEYGSYQEARARKISQFEVSTLSGEPRTGQADAKGALDTLFLGLGAVGLLVGAIGVANIMIISVLERLQVIGLRRALGTTKGQIRIQFLAEAIRQRAPLPGHRREMRIRR
jgi:putative ABC transport system permease protein